MYTESPTVEKNVPIPSSATKGNGRIQRFIRTLEVGDSFVTTQSQSAVYRTSVQKMGGKVSCRWTGEYGLGTYDHDKEKMIRVWLIKPIREEAA
jgi:hypothetical protein